MGFSKRRMESERAAVAAKEAEARRALGPQILADAEHLIATWNARQEAHIPMLSSPTIGAAITAVIGSCGSAARLSGPSMPLTCARSIVTRTRRSPA
jgi:hypothetical protein